VGHCDNLRVFGKVVESGSFADTRRGSVLRPQLRPLGRGPWTRLKVRKSLAHLSLGMPPPLTRPRCRARIDVGLAHPGAGRDHFGWHCQRVMAVIALHMPGKPIIFNLAC
jgi:hypothetical protein